MPSRYRACAKLSALPLPSGGWDAETASRALDKVRASEIEKHDCLLDLVDWSNQQLDSVRGQKQ